MWRRLVGAILVNVLLLMQGVYASNNSCGIGIETAGMTVPRGDIILEYGNPFRLMCILNTNHSLSVGKNVSDLHIFRDDKEVLPEFLTVINATTLEVYIEKPPISSSMYYCKLRNKDSFVALCLNRVVIDQKPKEVQNFSCISRNWQNLTCTWKKPRSFVDTTYELAFRLPGRAGGRLQFRCPKIVQNETDGMCFWDIKTDPHYRQPYEYYYFTLTGRNKFGNWTKQIKFHHYSHVLPAPAMDLTIVNTSVYSAFLSWKVPFPMQLFPPGILHKIEYQSQWDSADTWMIANTSTLSLHQDNYTYNLEGLKYANTLYDVRIYMRSPLAVGEDKWSQPTRKTFRTVPTIPGAAPKVDIGSFEVSGGLPYRDVYIYWQRIPDVLKNADNFEYKIISVEENGDGRSLTPDETTSAYAKFRGISFNSFKFLIVSANQIGYSQDVSVVYIPSKTESPPEPVSFTKIAFGDGKYELSWKPPANERERNRIENYTIFWCDHDRDRPYQCTGTLNWTHVPRTATIKTVTVPDNKIYQFAISANTRNASSGMVWASCTVIHNKVVGKMKSVWINSIGSTYIEVGWKLDCSDRIGTVEGFNIYYCPIVSPYNLTCKEAVQNYTVLGDPQTIHGRVENLKPYTTYMVAIAVITHNVEGLQSEPLYNTTMEDAPSRPGPVKVTEITNTTMVVTWQPPASMNGALRYYEIYYNNMKKKIDVNTSVRPEAYPLQVTLDNLTSFYNYSVSVAACTIKCSEKSVPVIAQTDIGVPGVMERPTVQGINSSMVLLSWVPPSNPAGLLNYYEVAVVKVDSRNSKNHSITRNYTGTVQGNTSMVQVPNCKTEGYLKYLFLVRAVNIGKDNETYYGNWSAPGESNCYSSGLPYEVIVVIWVCGFIVVCSLVVLFCYMGKRAWIRCKEMQIVEVKLPPGLAPNEKGKDDEYWPQVDNRDNLSIKPRSSSADEELLLQKKEERHGRNPSGDSSGCSSGHESVSSSLTSGTQCSTDSGTEVDQHPPSPDGVFPDSPTWESSSLRQRNVRPEGSTDGTRWDPYVKMGKPGGAGTGSVARSTPNLTELEGVGVGTGGYTCLGTWSSTGYISMPSSEEMGSSGVGGYCRVGLDGRPTESQSPTPQVTQPAKGYVSLASMIETSPSTSTANSSTHSSPRQPSQPPPRGYVTHHPLWPTVKEGSGGKGYVMAGEMANKVPGTCGSLFVAQMEEEEDNHGILESEENDIIDEELHSPESYCRFGIHPGTISLPQNTTGIEPEQDRTTPKPGSGYVTISKESRLVEPKMTSGSTGASGQEDRRAGASGGSGYVPHRQFDKTGFQDHPVYPPSVKSPSTSV